MSLREDLFEARSRIANASYHHEFNELVTACAILADVVEALLPNTPDSAEITLFKKPNDPNERVNKPNYNPPSFEDFDK